MLNSILHFDDFECWCKSIIITIFSQHVFYSLVWRRKSECHKSNLWHMRPFVRCPQNKHALTYLVVWLLVFFYSLLTLCVIELKLRENDKRQPKKRGNRNQCNDASTRMQNHIHTHARSCDAFIGCQFCTIGTQLMADFLHPRQWNTFCVLFSSSLESYVNVCK